MFQFGGDDAEQPLEGMIVSHLAWNASGKLVAAAVENVINIWTVSGRYCEQKNACKLVDLRALKFSPVKKYTYFSVAVRYFFVGFQRVPLKLHKIFYPCIEKYVFYVKLKF